VVCNPRRDTMLKAGAKRDRIDARKMAELFYSNLLRPVCDRAHGVRILKELLRSSLTISGDLARRMTRFQAVYRSRAIPCAGKQVHAPRDRAQGLGKISEAGVRRRAGFYDQHPDALKPLRHEVRQKRLAESCKPKASKLHFHLKSQTA
jgi:hypothetical protein